MTPTRAPRRAVASSAAARQARRLLRFFERERERISPLLILTHDYPDPDALASASALLHLAQAYGIEARAAYGGFVGRTENRSMLKLLRLPIHRLRPTDLKRYRHVALVDTQPRFRNNPFPPNRRATIVIDQHEPEIPPAADLALIDRDCGATCVIVAQALLLAKLEIPTRLATAIAYGILSDTLELYRATRSDVVHTYLTVLQCADMRALAAIRNPARTRQFFTTLARALRQASAYRRVVVTHLSQVSGPDRVAQVADFLLTYRHVNWSFCTGRFKGSLHLSLRAKTSNGQASDVLRDIVNRPSEAGGHGGIAGGRMRVGAGASDAAFETLEKELQVRLARRLRLPARGEFRRVFHEPERQKASRTARKKR